MKRSMVALYLYLLPSGDTSISYKMAVMPEYEDIYGNKTWDFMNGHCVLFQDHKAFAGRLGIGKKQVASLCH